MTRSDLTSSALKAIVVLAIVYLAFLGTVAVAAAGAPPHVATEPDTDSCSMCHRTHTSWSLRTWTNSSVEESRSALTIGSGDDGDTGLCFTCHGVDGLGAGTDIESAIEATSGHSIEPSASAFGPQFKRCGTCHDAHGTARDGAGDPYPALLRMTDSAGDFVYGGDAFCTTCHVVRPDSVFPGASAWQFSPHSRIDTPTGGTGIICAACHDSHGSPIAPSLVTKLATPSASAVTTVTGNDRSLCIGCHNTPLGLWKSQAAYAGSAHASSTATIAVAAEWAREAESRRVGECQACHAPMGAVDASGTLVPNLLTAEGRSLCDSCHGVSGPASTDLASFRYAATTPGNELVLSLPASSSAAFSRLSVWSREGTAAVVPGSLREVAPVSGAGALALGDVDGDNERETVLADRSIDDIALVERDPLAGLRARLFDLPGSSPAAALAVADVMDDASGLPEIIAVSADGNVQVTRVDGATLDSVATASLAGTPTAVAAGNLLGDGFSEIAVVTQDPDSLYIIRDVGGILGVLGPYATKSDPVAVALEPLDTADTYDEIVVGNAGETSATVSLFEGTGIAYAHGGTTLPAGSAVTALVAGDVLTGRTGALTSGAEIVLGYTSAIGVSGMRTIELTGTGFGDVVDFVLPLRSNASAIALGDADGDGDRDVAVALAGSFTRDSSAVGPSVRLFTPNTGGTAIAQQASLPAGGIEAAGGRAQVAIGDLGAVGPSRHPVGVAQGAHESTENVPAARHIECGDCHDPHRASNEDSDTPMLPGELLGAWGPDVTNVTSATVVLSDRAESDVEYRICFGCHSDWDPAAPARSIASEVNTLGASFHPVEGPARETSATGDTMTGYARGDVIRCGSCHGTSASSGPEGPHRSPSGPLLQRAYRGVAADDSSALCLKCHRSAVYVGGADDDGATARSGFWDVPASGSRQRLHSYHATVMGMTCGACHASHGAPKARRLLRSDVMTHTAGSSWGACETACHADPSAEYRYDR